MVYQVRPRLTRWHLPPLIKQMQDLAYFLVAHVGNDYYCFVADDALAPHRLRHLRVCFHFLTFVINYVLPYRAGLFYKCICKMLFALI